MVEENTKNINFINKAKKIHGDKYDYSLVEYINHLTKVKIICPTHGVFEQKPRYHLSGHGCFECGQIKIKQANFNLEHFLNKAKNIHGDKYDYSLVEYVNSKTKVKIICPIHGVFEQTPIYHYKYGCKKCSYNKKKSDVKNVIDKAKKVHGDKYDYSLVEYVNNKTKVKIICPTHGIFEQTPKNHLNGHGCPLCSSKEIIDKKRDNIDTFIDKAKKIHGDKYDYSLVEYINSITKVKIICPIHGVFEQPPRDHLSGHGCNRCKYYKSKVEDDIYEYLRKFYNKKIIKNDRETLNGKEIDIFLPEDNIGIEYCGLYWHSNIFKDDINYHLNKLLIANNKGVKLITIFENEWLFKNEIVKSKLKHIIGYNNDKIYARKTEIKIVQNEEFKEFLNKYHIQGYNKCSVKYGLFYNDELVSVIGFKKHKNYWDLNRFVSKYNVVGGFSKLLKHFVRNENPLKIITFADLRYTYRKDNVYLKNGFKDIGITKPNYFYFKKNNLVLESRIKYQKHKQQNKLTIYDKDLTEFENMKKNNYNWIYDCGNIKYELIL